MSMCNGRTEVTIQSDHKPLECMFDVYVYGRTEVTIQSDHKPLECMFDVYV